MKYRKMCIAVTVALSLYATSVVTLAEPKALYTVEDAYVSAARLSYDYNEGSVYQVYSKLGHVTDITLHANEKLVGVLAGDTERWNLETAEVANTVHIYIKPKAAGISTNFIINTDKRSYRLSVSAADSYNALVSWDFPEEIYRKIGTTEVYRDRAEKEFLDVFTEKIGDSYRVKPMNYFYEMKGSEKADTALFPVKVFDDGTRTYIQMSVANKYDLPVLYNVEDGAKEKITLVNYRVHGTYFIADRVFTHARLCYSSTVYIDIYPQKREVGQSKALLGGDRF